MKATYGIFRIERRQARNRSGNQNAEPAPVESSFIRITTLLNLICTSTLAAAAIFLSVHLSNVEAGYRKEDSRQAEAVSRDQLLRHCEQTAIQVAAALQANPNRASQRDLARLEALAPLCATAGRPLRPTVEFMLRTLVNQNSPETRAARESLINIIRTERAGEAGRVGFMDAAALRAEPSGPEVVSGPRDEPLLRDAMLAGHNVARAEVGAPPLRWSEALAADAGAFAREMATSGRFEHSRQPRSTPPQGENLWTGTRGAFAYRERIGHWLAERRFYQPRSVPESSKSGRFGDVGHYTQIVWRATSEVGCAEASSATADYLVCRYLPAGNVAGQMAF